jgi:hypothetical protein
VIHILPLPQTMFGGGLKIHVYAFIESENSEKYIANL